MVGWYPNNPQRRQHPLGVTQGGRIACAFPQEKEGCMNLSLLLVSSSLCCVLWGILGAVSVRLSTNHRSAGRSQPSMEQEDPS
jgi:hypothetical protein